VIKQAGVCTIRIFTLVYRSSVTLRVVLGNSGNWIHRYNTWRISRYSYIYNIASMMVKICLHWVVRLRQDLVFIAQNNFYILSVIWISVNIRCYKYSLSQSNTCCFQNILWKKHIFDSNNIAIKDCQLGTISSNAFSLGFVLHCNSWSWVPCYFECNANQIGVLINLTTLTTNDITYYFYKGVSHTYKLYADLWPQSN